MSRTQIPVSTVTRAGVGPPSQTANDSSNGMYFVNTDGLAWVEVVNSGVGPVDVGFQLKPSLHSIDTIIVPDRIVSVEGGSTVLVGPFPPLYDQEDGSVYVDPDAGTLLFRAYVLTSG